MDRLTRFWLLLILVMLPGFTEAHPDIDLRIHASHEPVALDGVTADIAIRYGDGRWSGLVAEKLFDNTFVPACSPLLELHDAADLPRHTLIHFRNQAAISSPVASPCGHLCMTMPQGRCGSSAGSARTSKSNWHSAGTMFSARPPWIRPVCTVE